MKHDSLEGLIGRERVGKQDDAFVGEHYTRWTTSGRPRNPYVLGSVRYLDVGCVAQTRANPVSRLLSLIHRCLTDSRRR